MAVLMGFHPGSLLLINQIKSDRGCLLLAVVMKFKSGYSFSVEVATQVVPKKLGITVVQNDQGDKVPTHTTTGWRKKSWMEALEMLQMITTIGTWNTTICHTEPL
ncbi:uncharacterized protein LOC122084577 isoform X2 [Macadamia integrifolia]|uniref:uncharacterized protein LOC122084577 isoform X2 n=1 Tax=Macadamia integrifolia TaxID=60698 RepID=UPI001C4FCE68|nr:uncharacterized protein LOC122084577 isoform X2 [Macadamia integrifolia]XP_042508867.1 uncharacterized protein LOC122084577 isoform X2 [Macadamia integrifolia]